MTVDLRPEAVLARLREASDASDLSPELRLHTKIDMTAEGVWRRLREVSELNELCEALRQR